ncbi:MAG: hypothetical protein ACRDSM_15330, partial [Pseudonocardiaceae bacterium]
ETVTRVFAELGAQALAGHAGVLLARRAGLAPVAFPISAPGWLPAIAVDGKALRGAAGTDGDVPYLLAAATHDRHPRSLNVKCVLRPAGHADHGVTQGNDLR